MTRPNDGFDYDAESPIGDEDKRTPQQWGRLLGKYASIAVIALATTWNGVNTYFAEKNMERRQEQIAKQATQTAIETVEVESVSREAQNDDGYTLLARTANVHTDKLAQLNADIESLDDLTDYVEWKRDQDVKRYGEARLVRMIERFIARRPEISSADTGASQEELIARIVREIANNQGDEFSDMPDKLGHIPVQTDFFKRSEPAK